MTKGIVITTSTHTEKWLSECIRSINSKYPLLIVENMTNEEVARHREIEKTYGEINTYTIEFIDNDGKLVVNKKVVNEWNGFELGGILRGSEHFDEFIHLMDTTIIKDNSIFDKLFEIPGHVFLTKGGYHYMGKFVSDDLPDIPKIDNKADAIALELRWLQRPATYFEPDLPVHSDVFEEKHGRKNMVLENDYLIKYKATWSL